MNKIISGLAVFLLVFLSVPIIALAQEESSTQPDEVVTQQTEVEVKANRQLRIDEIKQRVTDRLSNKEERRIAGLCKASQTIIAKAQIKVAKVVETRTTRYEAVSKKLGVLVTKLKDASVDTTTLEASIVDLDTKSTTLINDIESYEIALTDLAEMDCATDPSGFKAVLSEVRTMRTELVTQSKEIKTFVTVEIKAILNEIKLQLQNVKTEAEG